MGCSPAEMAHDDGNAVATTIVGFSVVTSVLVDAVDNAVGEEVAS